MKNLVLALVMVLALTACGDKKKSSAEQTSPEMESFMKMLDGKSATVGSALAQYGSPGLDKADMHMYNLENPKVVSANGNCYTMEAKSGMTTRTYELCWENKMIKSITDKGMK